MALQYFCALENMSEKSIFTAPLTRKIKSPENQNRIYPIYAELFFNYIQHSGNHRFIQRVNFFDLKMRSQMAKN